MSHPIDEEQDSDKDDADNEQPCNRLLDSWIHCHSSWSGNLKPAFVSTHITNRINALRIKWPWFYGSESGARQEVLFESSLSDESPAYAPEPCAARADTTAVPEMVAVAALSAEV